MGSAGHLRDRVTFQRLVGGADEYGNTVNAWADHLTVWANVMERLGGEKMRAGVPQSERMATIRFRRSTATLALTPADRINCRGQIWNVRSISAVGDDNAMLEAACEAGVAS